MTDSRCVAVILHFRTAVMTLQCMEALGAEGVDGIVVVDNSEDASHSLSELKALSTHIPVPVTYLEPGRNLGFGRGVNHALGHISREAPGADVVLVNSDAVLRSGSLRRLREAVAGDHPSLAAPAIDVGGSVIPARIHYRHLTGIISLRKGGLREHALLCGACLMVHRSLVTDGLFDEAFFFYGEDIEMAYRLQRRGVPLHDVDTALVFHAVSASAGNGSLFYEYHINRAHLLLVHRLGMGAAGRLAMIIGRIALLPARALVRSIRFRSLTAWKGLFLAVSDVVAGRMRTLTPPARTRGAD